jgi:hypothetical protein
MTGTSQVIDRLTPCRLTHMSAPQARRICSVAESLLCAAPLLNSSIGQWAPPLWATLNPTVDMVATRRHRTIPSPSSSPTCLCPREPDH